MSLVVRAIDGSQAVVAFHFRGCRDDMMIVVTASPRPRYRTRIMGPGYLVFSFFFCVAAGWVLWADPRTLSIEGKERKNEEGTGPTTGPGTSARHIDGWGWGEFERGGAPSTAA